MALYVEHRGHLRQGYEEVQIQKKCTLKYGNAACLFNGLANDLSQAGM